MHSNKRPEMDVVVNSQHGFQGLHCLIGQIQLKLTISAYLRDRLRKNGHSLTQAQSTSQSQSAAVDTAVAVLEQRP